MRAYDLVIRGGTIADGSDSELRTADVAVRDGVVVEVGRVDGDGDREVDADGALVTPGFVDVHTHYDAQVSWDTSLAPSSWHGVTTVVMGNCGVGFAPVRPVDRDRLIELMEGVEDIPGAVLHEGITWEWETFEEYLDCLDRRQYLLDVAAQVPHAALRVYTMGDRGVAGERATAADIETMSALTARALAAGALGFTTSRHAAHKTKRGVVTPSFGAAPEELVHIAAGMNGRGVLQIIADFDDFGADLALVTAMSEASGRPISVSLAQFMDNPEVWHRLLGAMEQMNADGSVIRAQVATRAIGMVLGLQCTRHPLDTNPVFVEIADLPLADKVRTMRSPAFRARVLTATGDPTLSTAMSHWDATRYDRTFELADPPDYEPAPSASIAARAAREGLDPVELVYDILLSGDGTGMLYLPLVNYRDGDLGAVHDMLVDHNTIPGLSDGGAHVGAICDGSFPTTLLAHWGRDRSRGPQIPVTSLVKSQTHDTARAVGLEDRGLLAPGYRADINVIDFDALRVRKPDVYFDLPTGGRRLLQPADGYIHTFVAGEEIRGRGVETGATPGRLVRGAQPAPDPSRQGA